ncbi:MAG: hypothetical protein NC299_13890 [Lachnospiraceae bacterium]|nr:hypothetical protein [Ruminococcus sp.]MCM1276427.1 hypothetical protein [Lachnospiraceae bacterium]
MTKVISKRAFLVLFTLVLSFCWLVVPVSAAEINNCENYCTDGAGVICIENIDEMQSRSVDSCLIDEIRVYAYGGINDDGTPIKVTVGNVYGYSKGPASYLYCRIPAALYDGMALHNYNKFLCYLTFSVKGTNIQRYAVKVNGTVVINQTLNSEGKVTVYWTCPRQKGTSYEVVVYSDSDSKTCTGRIMA